MMKMKDAWEGPVFRYFYMTMLLMPIVVITLIAIPLGQGLGDLDILATALGTIYLTIFFATILIHHQFMENWYSDRRFFAIEFQEARLRLEAVLASSGLSYRAVKVPNPQARVKLELGRGLGIELLHWDNEKCVIYVWPVSDRTRRDVDGLKRSIDAAFPPVK
jgi:hypothetical protein